METFSVITFPFDAGVLKAIADTVLNRTNLKNGNLTTPAFKKGFTEALGNAEADKYLSELQTYLALKNLPKALEKSCISFSKLDMAYDSAAHAYRSVGQLGIFSIGNRFIDKTVNGYVEIVNLYKDDMLNIYIELDKTHWFFFTYTGGEMQFITTDNAMNTAINNIKEAKRTSNVSKKETPYFYKVGTSSYKEQIHGKYRRNEPYYDEKPPLPDPDEVMEKPRRQKEQKDEDDDYDDYEDE